MTAGDDYRTKAAELRARARRERDTNIRSDLDNLARAFVRLAEQADRNSQADISYETPAEKDEDRSDQP